MKKRALFRDKFEDARLCGNTETRTHREELSRSYLSRVFKLTSPIRVDNQTCADETNKATVQHAIMRSQDPVVNFTLSNSSWRLLPNESTVNDVTTTGNLVWFRIVKLFLYTTIFIISAAGNSMVCVIILRRKKMKTVTNYFILNLAIADLALTCICIPFDIPVQEMNYVWPYGGFMCKILYPLQTLILFASIYTLTAVSLTRYWAIVHPLGMQLSILKTKVVIVAIWIGSLVPIVPYMNTLTLKNGSCEEIWDIKDIRSIYTVCLFVFQYVLPLLIIATAYAGIAAEMRRRDNGYDNCPTRRIQVRETRKVIKMLLVVTLCFSICVLPNNIMWLWLDFGEADQYVAYFWELVAFCNIVTFANSAANPICYTALNDNYRREFKRFFIIMFCKKRRRILLHRLSTMSTSVRKSMHKPSKEEYFGVPVNKGQPRFVGAVV